MTKKPTEVSISTKVSIIEEDYGSLDNKDLSKLLDGVTRNLEKTYFESCVKNPMRETVTTKPSMISRHVFNSHEYKNDSKSAYLAGTGDTFRDESISMEDLVESLNKAISSVPPSKSAYGSTEITEEDITLVRAALDSGTISIPVLFSGYR